MQSSSRVTFNMVATLAFQSVKINLSLAMLAMFCVTGGYTVQTTIFLLLCQVDFLLCQTSNLNNSIKPLNNSGWFFKSLIILQNNDNDRN